MTTAKRKICIVTGNRAEYSRCRTVMRAVMRHPELELQTVVTGAHLLPRFGMTVSKIESDGFPISEKIYQMVEGETPTTMARSIGLGICDLSTCFERLQPDIVIAPTDRFETLSVAISAAAMNIFLAHIQGGEVTGTIDESIRHAITKFSNAHFPATEESRRRIIALGESPEQVFNVGCPGTDVILETPRLDRAQMLAALNEHSKVPLAIHEDEPYLLLIQHPVTTEYGQAADEIRATLTAAYATGHPVIYLWPNIDAGGQRIVDEVRRFFREHPDHRFATFRHMDESLFVSVMANADCMLGNSSAGIRETCYLGTPVVNIGTRQNRRERGHNVLDAPYDAQAILDAITRQLAHGRYTPDAIYGDGTAGRQIAEILAGLDIERVQKTLSY